MAEPSETLTLIKKLAKIRAICDVAKKNKQGFNYTYTDIVEILAKVTAGMNKYGVTLIPTIVPGSSTVAQNVIRNTKVSKAGTPIETVTTEFMFSSDMVFKWVDEDNPQDVIEVPWFATASMSDASQSLGAALTYTQRQFLTAYFQIAQTDQDVDAYRSKQKEAEQTENREIAREITDRAVKLINQHLESNPNSRDKIIDIVKKHTKEAGKSSPNPNTIADPAIAARLLEEIQNFCNGTQKA